MKRIRILYVEFNEDHTVGGSHQALYDLVVGLDAERYEPIVVFYQENRFSKMLRTEGFDVHIFEHRRKELQIRATKGRIGRAFDALAAIGRRYRFMRDHRIDLLHLNNSPLLGSDDWLPAAKLLRIPCLTNVMGASSPEHNPVRRWLMKGFDRVITISQYITGETKKLGIPPHRITEVCLGVDVEGFRGRVTRTEEQVRAELGVESDRLLVAMVGNVRPWKGQQAVLNALQHMDDDTRAGLYIAFIGDAGPNEVEYLADLKHQVATAGWEDSVGFLGVRTDIPDLFAAADVALHASLLPEPFGLVIVEAMAVGTPVIAVNSGGPAEIITDNSGITYDVSDPQALAEILTSLVRDRSAVARLAAGALLRADAFTVSKNVSSMSDIYSEVFELDPV